MKDTIVLTGGGTAGHVMPNIAIIPDLEKNFDIHYIGTYEGMEHWLVNPYIKKGNYHVIKAGKLRRYLSIQNLKDPLKVLLGFKESIKVLRKVKPKVVFSKGGYVSVPVVFAAKLLRIPIVLHESDLTPGLANRLAFPRCDKVCVSFESTLIHTGKADAIFTGTPVRKELLKGDSKTGRNLCKIEDTKPVLMIMCGSQGAVAINSVVDLALEKLCKKFHVVHIRGNGNIKEELDSIDGYTQFEFIGEELKHIFKIADIILSRAGANAIFELLVLNLPSLLIPLPRASSRGDQILNAEHFKANGWSKILYQEDLTLDSLYLNLINLYEDKAKYKREMKKAHANEANEKIINAIYSVIK
jgi:UDP-N-acetylglucosamine--N-acetylmuramyl-(pentapeptide) pyrophosphoryl-undecaprenol N-acetylglucosamine transferase